MGGQPVWVPGPDVEPLTRHAGSQRPRDPRGCAPAAGACHLPDRHRGQDRPGGPQRGRQDHADQDPRRRGGPGCGVGHARRPGRLPAAGSTDRRPRGPGQEPHPVGAWTGLGGSPAAGRRGGHGRRLPGGPGPGDGEVRPRGSRAGRRRWLRRRVRGCPDRQQPGSGGTSPAPTPPYAVGRSAAAGGAGPDPVLRRRDSAAGRADQPPGRRLDRLVAQLPARLRWWADRDQPRRRSAGRDGHQGVPPGREPGRARHLRDGLEALPAAAGDRREASSAGADERRAQGRPADDAGRQDAGQGDQGGGSAEHGPAGRAVAGRDRGGAGGRPGGQDQVPRSGSERQDPVDRGRPEQVVRVAGGLHRR